MATGSILILAAAPAAGLVIGPLRAPCRGATRARAITACDGSWVPTDEEARALRQYRLAALAAYDAAIGADKPETVSEEAGGKSVWTDCRTACPPLAGRSDAELRAAALDLPPSPVEVFFKTPIGPVLLINLAFLVTGFSWCDTPFGDPAACASLGK